MDTGTRTRTPLQYLRLYFTGVAMGIADLIPGVSGGTMAFILGIYEELINAIKSFNIQALKLALGRKFGALLDHIPWRFLLVLGAGLGSAVFGLAHLMAFLLENERVYLFAFFFGLILASIFAVSAHVRWAPGTIAALLIGSVSAYILVGMVPLDMPNDPLTLFLSGMVAIMAMILPGISGSFILLILGQYEFILDAVRSLDLVTVAIVGSGAVIGLTVFSRVLSWLLKHYGQTTIAVLIGFMIGSLRVIWPWKQVLETRVASDGEIVPIRQINVLPAFAGSEFWVALALCLAGIVLVSVLDHQQSGSNPLMRFFGGSWRRSTVATAD